MGMRELLRGRTTASGILRGLGLAAIFVVVNSVAAFNLIPSSYQQFTWEAYAQVVYTDTPTPSPISTPTPTAPPSTPTPTPTAKTADGGTCDVSGDCQSGFCVAGTCCDSICNQPMQSCASGTCTFTAAPAPVVSDRSLVFLVGLLFAIGFFALTPFHFGKRH